MVMVMCFSLVMLGCNLLEQIILCAEFHYMPWKVYTWHLGTRRKS